MTLRASSWLRSTAAWGLAGAIVLSGHIGAAIWLMNRAEAAQIAGLPEPIFVELAALPEVADAPAEFEQPEMEEIAPEPEPEPEPEIPDIPLPELDPMPDMTSLLPPPADAVVLSGSSRPERRPIRERKPVEPEPKREVKRDPPAPAQQRRTALQAPQGARTAAPVATQGTTPSPQQQANWQQQVQSRVARHMQRARIGSRSGGLTATIHVRISANGSVISANLVASTGDARLDGVLANQASRIPKLPQPPSGQQVAMTIPVRIN